MITTYFRSSSLGNWKHCELQYFMTYVLGHKSLSGEKADWGTTVHAVFETLALCKKRLQAGDRKRMRISQDPLGDFSFSKNELYTDEFVKSILDRSFNFYKKHCKHNTFDDKAYTFCEKMVWDTLNHNNGQFDPRNLNILDTEPHFDIPIDEPWAKYSFDGPNGKIEGTLAIKGTIDLITELPDGTVEVIDWKGLPVNTLIPSINGWSTMEKLKEGDYIYDIDGLPTKVVKKSEAKIKPCYLIKFNTGEFVECDEDHLWLLVGKVVKPVKSLQVGDVLPRVMATKEGCCNHNGSNQRIITCIEKSIDKLTQCIMVDSPTRTYLCTENFIPTHNTGQRKDFVTGKKKDFDKLMKDTQLLLYNYAISKMYPDKKHRIMSIFFCRDGGPYTLAYDEEDMNNFMDYLKSTFNDIVKSTHPRPVSQSRSIWKCNKLCHFYKNNWPDTEKTMCHFIEDKLHTIGMNETVKNYSRKGFVIGTYKSPGEV